MARSLIRLREVMRRTGLCCTDVYRGMAAGTFPSSVPLGQKAIGWIEDEIDSWVEQRIAAGRELNRKRNPPLPNPARDAQRAAAMLAE
jgi:prophage regulatory protein